LIVKGEPTVYHVMSRTALDGFVLRDIEKEIIMRLSPYLFIRKTWSFLTDVTISVVSYAVQRGEKTVEEKGFQVES